MKKTLLVLAIMFSVLAITVSIIAGVKSVRFTNGCTSYLKLAANSATIERAEPFLTKVVDYIQKNDLDFGNSSIFIERPANDLEEWSKNIRASRNLLIRLIDDPNTSQLTKDNALLKIREIIVKESYNHGSVNVPDNIAFVPWQSFFVMFIPFFWLLAIIFWLWWAIAMRESE